MQNSVIFAHLFKHEVFRNYVTDIAINAELLKIDAELNYLFLADFVLNLKEHKYMED